MTIEQKTRGAIIYTRVSTCAQAEHGTSLPCQLEACRKKAEALSLPVVAAYEDAGISGGFLTTRDGMMQSIEDIRQGRADTLVIANMTRYSRDVEHQQQIKKAVRAAGGTIVFTDMHFDDTPEGDLAFNVTGAFAEYERKVLRHRSMTGIRRRVADGQQACRSRAPLGYHIPTKADILRGLYPPELLGKYVIVEDKANIVRRIFDDFLSGQKSLVAIARQLNQEGVPTPKHAAYWMATSVRTILTNSVYKGEVVFGKTRVVTDEGRLSRVSETTGRTYIEPTYRVPGPEAAWIRLTAPAVVSAETWELAQRQLERNQSAKGGNPKLVRMLSGRVYCPTCGGPMNVRLSGDKAAYTCGRTRRALCDTGRHICDGTGFRISAVEDAVVRAIVDACERPETIAEAIREYQTTMEPKDNIDYAAELSSIERGLRELSLEESAAVKAQIAGIRSGASADVYAAVFNDISEKRTQLENRRATLAKFAKTVTAQQSPKASVSAGDIRLQAVADVRLALTDEHLTGSEKRSLIAIIIDRVTCTQDGANITFHPGIFGCATLQSAKVDFVLFEP